MTVRRGLSRERTMETQVPVGAADAVDRAASFARRFAQTWGLVEWGGALEDTTTHLVDDVLRSAHGPVPAYCRPFAVRVRMRWTSSSTVLVEVFGLLAVLFGVVYALAPEYWICRADRLRVCGRGMGPRHV